MTKEYNIIKLRDNPSALDRFADYFSSKWISREIYYDSMLHSINTQNPLPRWYLLLNSNDVTIGCYGLITNDFNSRQDLWPWLCALYIEKSERGKSLGGMLLAHGVSEARHLGFDHLYLATDHIGYYEKYGFTYLGVCYGIGGEPERLYEYSC